ncbi:MAG: hypothetical protein HFE47_06855 [Clostridia bacterium]|nr:hypothetical protein [Clostridia bacterium]
MDNEEVAALKLGMVIATCISLVYAFIIAMIALSLNRIVFFALLGVPVLFALTYFMAYTLKMGIVKFLMPSRVRDMYSHDNFYRSELDKIKDSYFWAIVAFLPTAIFYFLFSWIFYFTKR